MWSVAGQRIVSDNRFEVVNGTLKLKSGVSLDYETEPTVHITITTVDAGGLTASPRDYTITVTDTNDTPSQATLSNNTVSENAAGAIVGHVSATDQDPGDTITYSVRGKTNTQAYHSEFPCDPI